MALLKKSSPQQFVVPTLVESDTEYRERVQRLGGLQDALTELSQERRRLEREISETPAPTVRASVAALLGDDKVDARTALLARLAEVRRSITDHETAIELQRRRVEEARGRASATVREKVKPEYGKRVAALASALEQAHAARLSLRELVEEMEVDGCSWAALGVFEPSFLGDREDGHVHRFVREAKVAGYV